MCAGTVTTLALIPEVRDAIGDLPMLAAGGIADGRGLAAVIALGADGAVFGTRFLASHEAAAHPIFKRARAYRTRGRDRSYHVVRCGMAKRTASSDPHQSGG